jgi:hypothetical protein
MAAANGPVPVPAPTPPVPVYGPVPVPAPTLRLHAPVPAPTYRTFVYPSIHSSIHFNRPLPTNYFFDVADVSTSSAFHLQP